MQKKDILHDDGENDADDHVSSEPIPSAVNKRMLIRASFGSWSNANLIIVVVLPASPMRPVRHKLGEEIVLVSIIVASSN